MRERQPSAQHPPQGGVVGAGCGLLLGLVLGAYWFITAEHPQWPILAVAVALALVAYWYGDRFWNWLSENAWSWRW